MKKNSKDKTKILLYTFEDPKPKISVKIIYFWGQSQDGRVEGCELTSSYETPKSQLITGQPLS